MTYRIYPTKPFLKWAGGKSQLLAQFRLHYPADLRTDRIHHYVEPFLGGGAVFFDIAQGFDVRAADLFDINEELILAYTVVQREPQRLVEMLSRLRQQYIELDDTGREEFFYSVRHRYNEQRAQVDFQAFGDAWIERAADMIFLNKTCFNGLFRVNAAGMFNVPFGRYKRPEIFETQNILRCSQLLQRARLSVGGFESCAQVVRDDSFVYFDPPYRPISKTASFTAYSRDKFGDDDQRSLAQLFAHLDATTNARLMLSNSNPRNLAPDDDFFDNLYAQFHIHQVMATRMINADAEGRGRITEILVTNYWNPDHDSERCCLEQVL